MNSSAVIVGIDEAGRGALAGPVVAAACAPSQPHLHPLIRDSKQLTPEERDEAYVWITQHCAFGVGTVAASVIDEEGILAATERAMQQAVAALAKSISPTYLLVDGRDRFWFDYPHTSIVRGDESEPCIAAASIIAKVTRDRWMVGQHRRFARYGFAQHKGYGTLAHRQALREHGPCRLHRQTFLHNILELPTATASATVSASTTEHSR